MWGGATLLLRWVQVPKLLQGIAGQSPQHRELLLRMAFSGLVGLAVMPRHDVVGNEDTFAGVCTLHGVGRGLLCICAPLIVVCRYATAAEVAAASGRPHDGDILLGLPSCCTSCPESTRYIVPLNGVRLFQSSAHACRQTPLPGASSRQGGLPGLCSEDAAAPAALPPCDRVLGK